MLFTYGARHGALRPFEGLPLQTVAMIVVGAGAALAVILNGASGTFLAAGGLFGHAGWDVYHHRVNRVVGRSMAEFCCVLDAALAAALVITAV